MNPRLREIAPSLIRAINARKRPGDIDLGLGEPVLRPDPAPFDTATAWVREHGCPYTPNAGSIALRQAVADYVAVPGLDAAENVCITVGSEEALFLAIKTVCDPTADEVLIVEPAFLAYPKICALEGVAHRSVALSPEDGFRPRASVVLDALRPETRLVVLNSPANPTGRVWPAEELRALAAGLAARPGPPTWVLSDEVYRELYYGAEPPESIARFHPQSLVAGSLSKSNALTGLRLGWLVGPREVVAGAVKVHQLVNTAASTYSEQVALTIFAEPASLAVHRPLYAERRAALLAVLERTGVPHIVPEGTFYCMVRLPEAMAGDSVGAAERLLGERRVVTVPGRAFGEAAEGWLRLSWVGDPPLVAEGVERIATFFAGAEAAV